MRSRTGSKNLKEEIKDIGQNVPIIKHRKRSSSLILDHIEQVVSGAILNSTNPITPLKQEHRSVVPTGSQQNLKSDVFFHCLHFAVGVVTFMWGVHTLYTYIFQASVLKNENKKESNFISWIIQSKSDWQSFSLLCIIGSVYTVTALTCLGMLFHSTFGFDFLNYLPYFYDSGQYPKVFSSNFADHHTLSHSERVEHEKHASILASVPFNDQLHLNKPQQPDNINKNKNKNTVFIKPRRLIQPAQNSAADSRILSPLSLSKVDVGSGLGLGGLLKENKFDGPSSDIDFVDGLWLQRIQRFKSGLNRQQVFQDQFNEQYKMIHDHYPPNNFQQRYLLCRPCYNRFNCHHLHVNYRGYRYHCQPYDMNFGPPRQKMSQIQVYKNNYVILERLQSRVKDSALTWSAPNDYPGRNLHEFISTKFPPVPDNVDNVFQRMLPLRSEFKQAEWDRIKNESADEPGAMRFGRFCPINDPCIVHKEKRKSSYRNGNSHIPGTLNDEVSKLRLRRSKMANRRMKKRLISKLNATNIDVDADADGDSEDDENMTTARTSIWRGKSDNSECDSDDGETWTNLDGPRVIYVNHSFDYTR